jgi:N-acetylglutamate synthase-like GNAT family acetyltransferase
MLISRAVEDIEPEHYSREQQRHLEEVIPEMNVEFAEEDRYNYFVALEDNEIIGVAGYQSESGTVAGIFVDPELKGSGIGSELMDKIETDARSEELDEMETLASLEAVGFYKKNGYKATEEKKHDIEGKDIGIKVMEKEL